MSWSAVRWARAGRLAKWWSSTSVSEASVAVEITEAHVFEDDDHDIGRAARQALASLRGTRLRQIRHFTAPASIPRTKWRWNARKTIKGTTIETIDPVEMIQKLAARVRSWSYRNKVRGT